MDIVLADIGKRYQFDWIFKQVSYQFNSNSACAITGFNGSGKSTLLKLIAGIESPSKGTINYIDTNRQKIEKSELFKQLSIVAPYQELIEELTLKEALNFHFSLREGDGYHPEVLEAAQLDKSFNKQIRDFSSGMKQRLKLILGLYTKSKILLLDEPTVNLDSQGTDWFLSEIHKLLHKRTIVVCSNLKHEFEYCSEILQVDQFKP